MTGAVQHSTEEASGSDFEETGGLDVELHSAVELQDIAFTFNGGFLSMEVE